MKRRFDCAGGRAEEMQQRTRGKRKTLHVAKAGSGQRVAERAPRAKPQYTAKNRNHKHNTTGLPESPWDPRLNHPWVAAYRRIHGKSNPNRRN